MHHCHLKHARLESIGAPGEEMPSWGSHAFEACQIPRRRWAGKLGSPGLLVRRGTCAGSRWACMYLDLATVPAAACAGSRCM